MSDLPGRLWLPGYKFTLLGTRYNRIGFFLLRYHNTLPGWVTYTKKVGKTPYNHLLGFNSANISTLASLAHIIE